jgi:hypothetical protein
MWLNARSNPHRIWFRIFMVVLTASPMVSLLLSNGSWCCCYRLRLRPSFIAALQEVQPQHEATSFGGNRTNSPPPWDSNPIYYRRRRVFYIFISRSVWSPSTVLSAQLQPAQGAVFPSVCTRLRRHLSLPPTSWSLSPLFFCCYPVNGPICNTTFFKGLSCNMAA